MALFVGEQYEIITVNVDCSCTLNDVIFYFHTMTRGNTTIIQMEMTSAPLPRGAIQMIYTYTLNGYVLDLPMGQNMVLDFGVSLRGKNIYIKAGNSEYTNVNDEILGFRDKNIYMFESRPKKRMKCSIRFAVDDELNQCQ